MDQVEHESRQRVVNDSFKSGESERAVAPASHGDSERKQSRRYVDREDAVNLLRGFCMGAADTVPGVSGGTVALILGHYQRLITAVSNVDGQWARGLIQGRFRASARHIDLRFLVGIGLGVVAGAVLLAGLMHWLLDHRRAETFAAFSGLIVASAWVVGRQIDRWPGSRWIACAAGIIAAAALSFIPPGNRDPSLLFLFVSGAVAITAMILPGISGAFVLLLLGVYHPVTELIKGLPRGEVGFLGLLSLAVFACGCAFGLLSFSRVLRWLLEHHRGTTLAALLGLMMGSLIKLWPLQRATDATIALEPKFRDYVFVSPASWEGSIPVLLAISALAAGCVVAAEWLATRLPEGQGAK